MNPELPQFGYPLIRKLFIRLTIYTARGLLRGDAADSPWGEIGAPIMPRKDGRCPAWV